MSNHYPNYYGTTSSTISYGSMTTTTANLTFNGVPLGQQPMYQNPTYPPKSRDTGHDCDLCGADIMGTIFWEIFPDGAPGRPFCSTNCRTLTFQADARLEREALRSLGVDPDA